MHKSSWLILTSVFFIGAIAGCSSSPSPSGAANSSGAAGRLQTILSRGQLKCGISGELPGFSFLDKDGKYSGLDVEVCRAIAAALFDKPDAVEYRQLNAKERFTALQTGEIDILSRNTTWTLSRDTSTKLEFAPVVFYDGQGMMVRQQSGITSLKGLEGKAICTQTGTTNEQNLTDQMRRLGISYKPVVFEDVNATFAAYAQGRCDGVTSDRSQLVSRRTKLPQPEQNIILEDLLSQEPLAPAVSDGDSQWADVVKWSVFTLFAGESLGITSKNVGEFTTSKDPVILRFLGIEGDLGKGMGLSNDFAARIIKHVGNYAEIYDRNLGPKTPLNLERGLNRLPAQGGLLFSPPFR
ncbi:MAG: amino acid ABC transporter substrate-binding protein [Thermosynechococcaceae cyanobacterium MS004]|nr:amino acid ABC transporter substrate-binding protein [Thermosynechococcaceae cyanobacterium MS004]